MATTLKPTTPNLGNGGVNYNTADAEMKRKIAQNQMKIANDPTYNQNEISRTLQIIRDREAAGQGTADQQKYLTQNLGYKPTTTAAATTTSTPTAAATPTASNPSSDLMSKMLERLNQPQQAFSYDPNSDPAYQAAMQRARANINDGNAQAQAEMNRRNILNSTITSDRMGEIASNEMGNVETTVIPQLMQQAYQQYVNKQQQDQQQFANMGNLAQMYSGEDQRNFNNGVTVAGLTGNYMPLGAQEAVSNILSLKQQAEAPGITPAERAQLSAKADGYRAQLASMGIDASQYGSAINYNTAKNNNAGLRTLQGQQFDMQKTQQQFDNNMAAEQFAYQKARDAIGDAQWKAQFDQNTKEFGLNYALQKLQQTNDQAYRQATLAIDQDQNARAWLDLQNSSVAAPKYDGVTANQAYDAVRSRFADENGKIPNDPVTKDKIYQQVMSMGLPDGQDSQVMSMLGLSAGDISTFDKKYGVTTGK